MSGILSEADPVLHRFSEVHIWAYHELLSQLPDYPWLRKHIASDAGRPISRQLWWERYDLPRLLREQKCDILFNVDAGTVCRFQPNIVLSQDMLSFEPGEMERYGWTTERLRLIAKRWLQGASLRQADVSVFLTQHAASVIQASIGNCKSVALIPHGIDDEFRGLARHRVWPDSAERSLECLYVSNAAPYKHQWHVVRAIEILRNKGHALHLSLVGGGAGPAQARLQKQMIVSDPHGVFVSQLEFASRAGVRNSLLRADVFVFASSCENMPITLLEAMAAGLPIACSNRGPMPEVLQDGGEYFDPEDPSSISDAIERLVINTTARSKSAERAFELAASYTWRRCAAETFSALEQVVRERKGG